MRLATFNILHGRSPVDDRVDLDRFVDAVKALGLDDTIFEVNLTPNRGDCLSIAGLAREVERNSVHHAVAIPQYHQGTPITQLVWRREEF